MSRRNSSLDLKIVVLGSAFVGKTSIINRYCNSTFIEETLSTIGAGFFTRTMNIDNMEVTIMLWDTAGEERFRSVAPSLLRGANGLVLVYDVTNVNSFNDIDIYMDMYLDTCNADSSYTLPVLLLGNKCDLERTVTLESVEEWKKKNKVEFSYDVSAKTGENVDEAFQKLVENLVKPERNADGPAQFIVTPNTPKNKEGCC